MSQLTLPNFKHPGYKVAGVLVVLLLAFWGLVHVLVDKENVAKQLRDGITQVTGYEVTNGNVALSFFPIPKITIERLAVENAPYATTEYFLITEKVEVAIDIMALMMGEVKPGKIAIIRPVMELETYKDMSTNWDFLKRFTLTDLGFISPTGLRIDGGSINFNNSIDGNVRDIDFINFYASFDSTFSEIDLELNFKIAEKYFELLGVLEAKAFSSLSQYSFGADMDLREGKNHIVYKGDIGQGNQGLTYDGVFTVDFVDITPWLEILFVKKASDGIFKNLSNPVPLQMSGKAQATGTKFSFTQIKIGSGKTSGVGQIISDENVFPQTQIAFNFSALDTAAILDPKRSVSDEAFNDFFADLLPKGLSSSIDLHADEFYVGGVPTQDATFLATLDDGEMVINQAAVHLPGDAELLVFGIVKHSLDRAIHFDGSIELIGKHLLEFAHAFQFDKNRFITDHDGEFRAKASLFLSRTNSVISDFKFQAGSLLASGGMTSSEGNDFDREFTLRVSGIKLDPFTELVVPSSHKDMEKSDFEDIVRRLDWLDNIHSRIKLNLVLQNYSLSKTTGQQSTMQLYLEQGRLIFQETKFELGGIVFSGDLEYQQRGERPLIRADMSISSFNLEPFTPTKLRKKPVRRNNFKPVWSKDFFSFGYLKGYDSDVDIRIKKVFHPDFPMQNMRLVATSTNGNWDLKSFRADIWDGAVKVNGNLDVMSIPALSVSFSFENIDSVRLFEAFAGHTNFLGSLSLNGQFSTSGLNALNWVKNARGTFVVLGQSLVIKGFDISSLVQAIPSMRSVADVINTARVSMLRRHTSFSVAEGSFYLDNGVFRFSELKLRAKHSIGSVTGYLDASTWVMDCVIDFALITLARGDFPSISIHFTNSIDDPEITMDTRSLESFIARKYLRP